MKSKQYMLLLVFLAIAGCHTHLNRYVTVYDQAKQPVKATVIFQTFDWNNLLGTMNNGGTVAVTSSRGPVKVKIPNHKEISVGIVKPGFVGQNPSAKIRFKAEGDLDFCKILYASANPYATKSRPTGYSILISKDPIKTWRDYECEEESR